MVFLEVWSSTFISGAVKKKWKNKFHEIFFLKIFKFHPELDDIYGFMSADFLL
jgi:hypothetical protein